MSKAFDTINHFTLLSKMEYYGIRGQTLEIFKFYLKNRRQFVEIDTYRSDIKQSLDCSVIQGSKMSGILYIIYTNEIPLIHTLMLDEIFTKLTGKPISPTKDIEHSTINFVDDSTNLIMTKDPKILQTYLDNFYLLLLNV